MTRDIVITGASQLYELNRRLKAVDRKLATKLRKNIRAGAQPAVAATKQAILTLPVAGSRGGGNKARTEHRLSKARKVTEKSAARAARKSGLRRTIADAIKVDIRTGSKTASVRILVDESRLPPDQRTLPRHLDSARGWRHPVFGRRDDPWVTQKGRPWFEVTIRKHADEVRSSIVAAMDEMARDLDK